MTESERAMREARARQFPQLAAPRDPLARAIAKALFLACALLLASALLWMAQNVAWQFIGQ